MEHANCNVIYIDRRVREDRFIKADAAGNCPEQEWETWQIAENSRLLLDVFGEVFLCGTGGACLSQWLDLQDMSMVELKPTLILVDTPFEDRLLDSARSRTPSPTSPEALMDERDLEEDLYGLELLQRIHTESHLRNLSKLVVLVPVIVFPPNGRPPSSDGSASDMLEEIARPKSDPVPAKNRRAANRRMVKRCLDLGATDVMANPMNSKCITNLEVHAYRAHREAARDKRALLEVRRGRKQSWVGISEEKPFSYLREAMVSGLMNRICRIDNELDDPVGNTRIYVPAERQTFIAKAVGRWHFCAHDFSDDELIVAASVIFKHALMMPELEEWRLPTDQLHSFLIACRAAYNNFVPYHNFRHVVDVLQATFSFLVNIGALPPYPAALPAEQGGQPPEKSPVAELLRPFDAFTLLITAIGHDVGHPGVNNGFLEKLNAPLAQLYNDRSVLEAFHCAAYSQILRRWWPSVFSCGEMRKLMISSILATDMALHFDYMNKMGDLQDKIHQNNSTDGWNGRAMETNKALVCALLIKCADISNVARNHSTALQWMHILSDEFSRQATMETELEIPTSLMAQPKKDMKSLSKAQLGFMNLFAIPLFQGVADLMPTMRYTVDELEGNKMLFEQEVAKSTAEDEPAKGLLQRDGTFSPRTMSMAVGHEPPASLPTLDTPLLRPTVIEEDRAATEKEFLTKPVEPVSEPAHVPDVACDFKEMNGIVTSFDVADDLAAGDPFQKKTCNCSHVEAQRCSETTEDGSLPYHGDWASQVTSATTSKIPISPSTQGTSVVSRDSVDRPVSVPFTTVTAPESTTTAPESAKSQTELTVSSQPLTDDDRSVLHVGHVNGRALYPESELPGGKLVKKKSSRFRMNVSSFFRKHNKSSSPPQVPATDTAG